MTTLLHWQLYLMSFRSSAEIRLDYRLNRISVGDVVLIPLTVALVVTTRRALCLSWQDMCFLFSKNTFGSSNHMIMT
jgi:hypothetical protein